MLLSMIMSQSGGCRVYYHVFSSYVADFPGRSSSKYKEKREKDYLTMDSSGDHPRNYKAKKQVQQATIIM